MAMTDVQAALLKHVQTRQDLKIFEMDIPKLDISVKMRGLSSSEYLRLVKECSVDGNLEITKFKVRALTECLIDPDFHDVEFLKQLDVTKPEDGLLKVFSDPGVLQTLESYIYDPVLGFSEKDANKSFRQLQ